MILQIEILSTEFSDFLKQIIFLKAFNSVFILSLNLFPHSQCFISGFTLLVISLVLASQKIL